MVLLSNDDRIQRSNDSNVVAFCNCVLLAIPSAHIAIPGRRGRMVVEYATRCAISVL
jgi:hypothetical protein